MYGQILYLLGKFRFLQYPFECHDVNRETSTDYAPKDVIQAARPREWVGEGDEHIRMIGAFLKDETL